MTATRGPAADAAGAGCWTADGGVTMTHCSPAPQIAAAQLGRLIPVSYCALMLAAPRKSPLTMLMVPSAFTPVTMPTWSA